MQSHKRVLGSAKKISLHGQSFVINQMPPLNRGASQECCPEEERQKPPPCKCRSLRLAQGPDGQMNRQAARKQADGEQDGHMKHLLGCRSAETLAHINPLCDNKHGK